MLKNIIGINKSFFRWTREKPKDGWCETYNGVDYHMSLEDDTLFIKLQQTVGIRDWFRNFNFIPGVDFTLDSKLCLFHNGFLIGASSCVGEIIKYIIKNEKALKNIVISGYSQGAAIALIIFKELKEIYKNKFKFSCYAFAPPRVVFFLFSWNVFSLLKEANLIMARGDIVVKNPCWWIGYRHIGKKYKIGPWQLFAKAACHEPKYYETHLKEV